MNEQSGVVATNSRHKCAAVSPLSSGSSAGLIFVSSRATLQRTVVAEKQNYYPIAHRMRPLFRLSIAAVLGGAFLTASPVNAAEPAPLRILFLGDQGPHRPGERFQQLQPVLARRNIGLTYTEHVGVLNARDLEPYDALLLYANLEQIEPRQERALLEFVASGKGFVPVHCASYCFLNSAKFVELVGAQFQRHGAGIFTTRIAEREHPVFRGYETFESWDETYTHHRHNEADRIVLEYRDEGDHHEPWTWIRRHGQGRVFYTAWGHDDRTWGHPGFHALLERGIRWAAGADPSLVPTFIDKPQTPPPRTDVAPFEYAEADVPYYPAGKEWGTLGEPIRTMQKPLAPEESLKHFRTPVGFTVELFAAEPEIGKPIAMTWDERGRLWIAETVDYPNELQPAGEGHDRIRICEDTDGDGRADRFTVFAERLSIPTGLVIAEGGVIVAQAPDMLFLKDTTGDDVADERRVLFSGWGTRDTHSGPSNLRYGLDNGIYGMVGYSGFEGTVGGEAHSFRQGFFRFRPDGTKLEFLRGTNNNSWGLGFSEEGVLFGSTANGNPSEYMPIANRYYEQVHGWSSSVLPGIADTNAFVPSTGKVRQVDWHGGFTAAAGHALYTAREYPREYWNRTAFVCEPTGHLVATFCLQPNGAGYRSRNRWNLLSSDDEWCAPIMAEVGPDGQVWVVDWYNYIVQHNPTPAKFKTGKGNAYETDLRDKTHGRIYRVVYRDRRGGQPEAAGRGERMSLDKASPEKLAAALQHDNMLWRLHAQRLLVERGRTDVVPLLEPVLGFHSIDELGLNAPAIHALWTLHGLGVLDGPRRIERIVKAAERALKHPAAGVRRAALKVLPKDPDRATGGLIDDPDGQVRLAALLAMAEIPDRRRAGLPLGAALVSPKYAQDRWMLDALTIAAARNARPVLRDLLQRDVPESMKAIIAERVEMIAAHFASASDAEEAARGIASFVGESKSPVVAEAIVAGLDRGWPTSRAVPIDSSAEERLVLLLPRVPPTAQSRIISLGIKGQSEKLMAKAVEFAGRFLAKIRDESLPERERITAAAAMIDFRRADPAAAAELLQIVTPRTSPELSRGLLDAVGRSEAAETGGAIAGHWASITPAAQPAALRALLSRPGWTPHLLAAIEDGRLRPAELSLEQKQSLAIHPDRKIRDRATALLARGGGLPDPDRQKVLDGLLPLTKETGDAVLGKSVYVNNCGKCHVHGALGTRIGPDLTGVAVHPKAELLTNIIDPSRSVEGNFRVFTVVTTSGKIVTGLLSSESKTAIELIDSEAKRHVVQRVDIDEFSASGKSLMPDGFEKNVSRAELSNLLEFLAQRGKFLPLDLRKAATIVSTKGMFFDEASPTERLVFADWSPKIFDGVPFQLVDPQGDRVPNAVLLHGPHGPRAPQMPRSVAIPCRAPARAIHLLSGVSGWGYPLGEKGLVSLIVRLHYSGGATEDHPLKNGEHFADYIRRVDVPGSKFAYALREQQLRYLAVFPERGDPIETIELVKGADESAPIVMAVTVEARE